jgi:hypothetical protein
MNDDPIPDLLLERLLLGELPPAEHERLRRRLGHDPALRQRLDEMEREEAPWALLAAGVQARLRPAQPPLRSRHRGVWVTVAAAGALGAVAWPVFHDAGGAGPRPAAVATPDPMVRAKGLLPALRLFRKTRTGSEVLNEGARGRKGDLIRIAYRAGSQSYGTIVSVDGRGTVTRHLPAQGTRAVGLGAGEVLLDSSYELDDAPRFETFYLVTGPDPFELEPVLAAAQRAGGASGDAAPPLPLAPPLAQSVVSLEKGHTR